MSQLFYKGQKLVCVVKTWYDVETNEDAVRAPAKGEIVTCDGYDPAQDRPFIYLVGYTDTDAHGDRHAYNERGFVPIPEQRVDARADLISGFKEIKEGADGPVKIKELETT